MGGKLLLWKSSVNKKVEEERNRSVTWEKPVDLAGIPAQRQAEFYQVRVHVMGNICCCLIQPYNGYLVSVDTKERWHYKVLSLSLPDLKNPVRLNGYESRALGFLEGLINLIDG